MVFRRWEILVNSYYDKNLRTPAAGRLLFFTKWGAEDEAAQMQRYHSLWDDNRYGITYYVIKRKEDS